MIQNCTVYKFCWLRLAEAHCVMDLNDSITLVARPDDFLKHKSSEKVQMFDCRAVTRFCELFYS